MNRRSLTRGGHVELHMFGALLVSPYAAAAKKEALPPDEALSAGHTALRKGLHHKAYEHYKTYWRHDPKSAFNHVELQEGLCVCAAKLRKEKVAITACDNATAIRAGEAAKRGAVRDRAQKNHPFSQYSLAELTPCCSLCAGRMIFAHSRLRRRHCTFSWPRARPSSSPPSPWPPASTFARRSAPRQTGTRCGMRRRPRRRCAEPRASCTRRLALCVV